MTVQVNSLLHKKEQSRGLGGFAFIETPVEALYKRLPVPTAANMAVAATVGPSEVGVFMVFAGEAPVGGAIVC